jgi:predicted dehydrogenase
VTRLRIGVIGLGAIAQIHHLPSLERLSDRYELRYVCDLSPSLVDAVARRYNVPHTTTEAKDVCTAEDLDAVLLLTSGSHGSQARIALDHGLHVLAEKPLCYTQREAHELAEAARRGARVLQVGYMKSHERVMPAARAAVEELGELRLVRHVVLHPSETAQQEHLRLLRFGDADPARIARLVEGDDLLVKEAIGEAPPGLAWLYRELALGSIVHYLSVFRSLLGRLPSPILRAEAWPLDLERPPTGWGPDDVLPTLSVFASLGTACRLELTWAWLQHYPAYTEIVEVLAPTGGVRLKLPPPYLHHRAATLTIDRTDAGQSTSTTIDGGYDAAFGRELRDFHTAITTGTGPKSGAEAGADDARWCQELVGAIAHGRGLQLGGEATAKDLGSGMTDGVPQDQAPGEDLPRYVGRISANRD